MKLKELLNGTGISPKFDMDISGVSINSKNIGPSYIFFALKGSKTDGNLFIKEAISKGAAVIVSEDDITEDVKFIKSNDILKTLSVVSKNFYSDPSARLYTVGVTGTKGKTTVSYIIENILNSSGINSGVIGTINYRSHKRIISPSENTTPLAPRLNEILCEIINDGDKSVVLEVSSHSLKLKRVDDISFDAAVFTNLQSDHLDFHKDLADYASSKLHLFELLNQSNKNNKVVAINADDPFSKKIIDRLDSNIRVIGYSLNNSSELRAKNIELKADSSSFEINDSGQVFRFETHLIGKHNIYNILASLSLAKHLNIDFNQLIDIIRNIKGVKGRLEKIDSGHGFYVYIDYAHTEESLRQVLKTLNSVPHKRIITVFGCGGDRDKTKRAPMADLSAELSDFVIITSDNPRTEDPEKILDDIEKKFLEKKSKNYKRIIDRKEAIFFAINEARAGDILLVAGKGHEDYQIIGSNKIHFSDAETVSEALKEKYGT
jgi:UDP-N-acetylmuramoyl-L-alanyl-D-glutamate--2,6-diaminopimelate ligase